MNGPNESNGEQPLNPTITMTWDDDKKIVIQVGADMRVFKSLDMVLAVARMGVAFLETVQKQQMAQQMMQAQQQAQVDARLAQVIKQPRIVPGR